MHMLTYHFHQTHKHLMAKIHNLFSIKTFFCRVGLKWKEIQVQTLKYKSTQSRGTSGAFIYQTHLLYNVLWNENAIIIIIVQILFLLI